MHSYQSCTSIDVFILPSVSRFFSGPDSINILGSSENTSVFGLVLRISLSHEHTQTFQNKSRMKNVKKTQCRQNQLILRAPCLPLKWYWWIFSQTNALWVTLCKQHIGLMMVWMKIIEPFLPKWFWENVASMKWASQVLTVVFFTVAGANYWRCLFIQKAEPLCLQIWKMVFWGKNNEQTWASIFTHM